MYYNNHTRMNFKPFHAKTINAHTYIHTYIHHIERFMVIEMCPNMLLRGLNYRQTCEELILLHILWATVTKTKLPKSRACRVLRRL